MLKITTAQAQTISNYLYAAADQFSSDAHAADLANQPRVAEQFRRQRAEARTLAAWIEENDED